MIPPLELYLIRISITIRLMQNVAKAGDYFQKAWEAFENAKQSIEMAGNFVQKNSGLMQQMLKVFSYAVVKSIR